MAVNSVSTYGSLQSLLQNMGKVQYALANSQQQVSSGLKAQTYDGLNGSIEQYSSLSAQVTRLKDYEQSNGLTLSRLQSVNTVLGQMIQVASSLKSLTVSQVSNTQSAAAFGQQMSSNRETLINSLNTTFQGNYIFGGTRTDIPPVKTPLVTPVVVGTPDTGYYQGSSQNQTARIADNQDVTFDVRADDVAFQRILAGVDQALRANGSSTEMKAAQDLIESGMQGLIALQAKVNASVVNLQQVSSQSQTLKTYYTGLTQDLTQADLVTLSTKVVQDQTILQASFSVFSRISSLSLASYLK